MKFRLVEQACRAAYAHDFIEKLPEVRALFFKPAAELRLK
jgi:ABC-type multidrug transport system fused ATPase/permease subunit